MNFSNKSVNLENITSIDVNKAIQRSITKASARHGLGIYIYAGEDLPEVVEAAVVVTKSDGLLPLTVKDDNWSKVTKYVVENKAMGVKRILDSLSRKYKISAPVKTAISKMIGV
jgi:hypothetical protein